jgi:disulfide bond formation protein DsbB
MSEHNNITPQTDGESSTRNLLITLAVVTGLIVVNATFMTAGWIYGSSEGRHARRAGPAIASRAGAVGNWKHGRDLFGMTCITCHGPDGAGIPKLGANLRESKFVAVRSDDQLIDFIKHGRQPGEPNSVLNLTMPPKGGNPALNDDNLHDIVAFIRTLQAQARQTMANAQ